MYTYLPLIIEHLLPFSIKLYLPEHIKFEGSKLGDGENEGVLGGVPKGGGVGGVSLGSGSLGVSLPEPDPLPEKSKPDIS
jgi:hypothetical protein